MKLETTRLVLRAFELDDFAAVHEYASDAENVKYMIWGPNSEQDTKNFIQNAISKGEQDLPTDYDFAVTLKDGGRLIGGCGAYLNGERNEAMLGWILNRRYWKQGIGTELASALIDLCFKKLGVHRVYATCDYENYGSYRVMERNNMRREGHFLKNRHIHGVWRDEYHYAILDEEWCG